MGAVDIEDFRKRAERYNDWIIYYKCAQEYDNLLKGKAKFMPRKLRKKSLKPSELHRHYGGLSGNDFVNYSHCGIHYGQRRYTYQIYIGGSDVMFKVVELGVGDEIKSVRFTFLGSNDAKDWMTNGAVKKNSAYAPGLHTGFLNGALEFETVIRGSIDYLETIGCADIDKRYSGYSRGGALPPIALYLSRHLDDLDENGYEQEYKDTIYLTTFAAPKCSGTEFLTDAYLFRYVNPENYHMYVINGDPVVSVPPGEMGYHYPDISRIHLISGPWWTFLRIPFLGVKTHLSYNRAMRKHIERRIQPC